MKTKKELLVHSRREPSLCAGAGARAAIMASIFTLGIATASAHYEDSDHPDKAGRIMLNARGGLALGISNAERELYLMGLVGIDLGVAVSANYNAYITLTPQVQLRPDLYNVMVPLGFQYDIRLARGLYLYPRVSLGYAALISNAFVDFGPLRFSANQVTHGGVGIPEVGLKYVVNGRFNIGVEPLSFSIFFTDRDYVAWYRATAFLGANF